MRGKLAFRTFRFISATLFLLTIYYVIIAICEINNFFKTFNKSVFQLYASYASLLVNKVCNTHNECTVGDDGHVAVDAECSKHKVQPHRLW